MAFSIFLVFFGVLSIGAADSCYDPKYEKYPNHAMCLKPESCQPDKVLLTNLSMTNMDEKALLHVFNIFRSLTASGHTGGYHPAINMQQLTWNAELAAIAQRRAENCDYAQKFNASVDQFEVGQWIEARKLSTSDDNFLRPNYTIDLGKAVYLKAYEIAYPARFIDEWQELQLGSSFTQLLWAETKFVGCGASAYIEKEPQWGIRMLICNFAPKGNKLGKPVYIVGEPYCDIESDHYEGLCTTKEVNKNFEPIPCHEEKFATEFKSLCRGDEVLYKWIGHAVPYPHTPCYQAYWSRMLDKSLWALLVTLLAMLATVVYLTYCYFFVPFRIFLV